MSLRDIEQRIAEAEQELHARQAALQDSAIMSDGAKLHSASTQLDEARKNVDQLYARWAELDIRKAETSDDLQVWNRIGRGRHFNVSSS